jgi:imidazolonepropionase-like amidohydrolase
MRNNYASLDDAELANDPRLLYVKPSWRKRWLSMTEEAGNAPDSEWAKRKETVHREKALVGTMQKGGVGILAGTDDSNPYVIPGFSLHDELELLVESGLTAMQALQAATVGPAKFLYRLDSLGTVAAGMHADLVLLDANPLINIRNTTRINAVVVNGRLLGRNALNEILAQVESEMKK